MAAINNLHARYYKPSGSNLPIILLLHGWDGGSESITDATLKRIGDYGAFTCTVSMRGRNGANGARDASGREIYDIYDCLQAIISNHGAAVDSSHVAVWGYSGGGGNVLGALCKFPDAWNIGVDFFGISDYGRDATNGWYQQGYSQAALVSSVGGTPAAVPNNYYARDATAAIRNYSGGHLYMYHDNVDSTVPKIHSERIKSAFDSAPAMTNYTLALSNDLGHGYPDNYPTRQAPEPGLVSALISSTAWTIPSSGTITVIGYIVTKRFTIWLNTGSALGIDAVATVTYNTETDSYTVTPLTTGAIDVTITQGSKTGSATDITGVTLVTVS